jgi:hypothetical protein
MFKTLGITALLASSLLPLVPQVASARDYDRDDYRAWARHERRERREHERWEHRHRYYGYRYGYYDRYGYWHGY